MRKLPPITTARLVKQVNDDWYIVWYAQHPTQRFRHKFGMNRIKDLELRQQWANKILNFINQTIVTRQVTPVPNDVLGYLKNPYPLAIEWSAAPPSTPAPLALRQNPKTFAEFVVEFIDARQNILEHGTLKVFTTCYNNLCGFALDTLKKPAPNWSDFEAMFPLRFQSWCYAKPRQHSQNYVSKLFDVLRQFLREAEELDYDCGRHWKTKRYKINKLEVDEIALTFAELESLNALALNGTRANVRDAFVFACLTGLRFSDFSRLKQNNFKSITQKNGTKINVLQIVTQKTGVKVMIPLHQIAEDIIERNNGMPHARSSQTFNRMIKVIAKDAQLTDVVMIKMNVGGKTISEMMYKYECIASHTARRTFATYAFMELKMPAMLIMKITGHRTEREFFKYIRVTGESVAVEMYAYMKTTNNDVKELTDIKI